MTAAGVIDWLRYLKMWNDGFIWKNESRCLIIKSVKEHSKKFSRNHSLFNANMFVNIVSVLAMI